VLSEPVHGISEINRGLSAHPCKRFPSPEAWPGSPPELAH
jgi:hypothetical protein